MLEILLIRHGETAWNAERRMQGHLDIALNDAGLQQAAALGQALRLEEFDAIVSSDLQRASMTAAAVAAGRTLTVGIDAGLRERCFGGFEGLLYDELSTRHPAAYAAWKARELDTRYPAGANVAETLREFSDRSLRTIDRLAASVADGRPVHRRIALVTHGGVLECAYRAATGTSLELPRDFAILNASVNRLRWTAGRLEVLRWADVDHLQLPARDEVDRA
ncbi:MAG: histidine phosphatase family protein [Herminiimonas sp.]|nr:histidine phosphatase family protein [Herminiimonas sp.]